MLVPHSTFLVSNTACRISKSKTFPLLLTQHGPRLNENPCNQTLVIQAQKLRFDTIVHTPLISSVSPVAPGQDTLRTVGKTFRVSTTDNALDSGI